MSELYDILTETPPTKVVLLALDQGLWDCERSLAELSALCEANHMEAVAEVTQKRQTPETGIVLGSGKLEEACLAAQTLGAECAVFDGELTGSQIRNISNALGGLEVIDRTMLILEIFRSRAVTNEGKLQTELALLRYRLPRLQGMGEALSRQGGGGGGGGGARRGAGETKLELDRRHVHARIDALAEKLAEMEKRRGESRKARAKTGMPVVSLVGYTNVGKSSLINKLCNRKNLARVSSTPGKTATINFYAVDDCYFVDLPGYGYAKVSNADRERWDDLINSYFEAQRHHTLLVQLLDCRHAPSADDLQMLRYLHYHRIPYVVALTKADKLKKSQLAKTQEDFENICRPYGCQKVVLTSGENGYGIPELQAVLNAAVAAENEEAE